VLRRMRRDLARQSGRESATLGPMLDYIHWITCWITSELSERANATALDLDTQHLSCRPSTIFRVEGAQPEAANLCSSQREFRIQSIHNQIITPIHRRAVLLHWRERHLSPGRWCCPALPLFSHGRTCLYDSFPKRPWATIPTPEPAPRHSPSTPRRRISKSPAITLLPPRHHPRPHQQPPHRPQQLPLFWHTARALSARAPCPPSTPAQLPTPRPAACTAREWWGRRGRRREGGWRESARERESEGKSTSRRECKRLCVWCACARGAKHRGSTTVEA
jgi:hypothetical protein